MSEREKPKESGDLMHLIQTCAYPRVIHPDHALKIRNSILAAGYRPAAAVRAETVEACAKVAEHFSKQHKPVDQKGRLTGFTMRHIETFVRGACEFIATDIRALAPGGKGESDG